MVIVGVWMEAGLFLPYLRDHVPHQQLVVLHHGPDGLKGDGRPAVPDPVQALHP